MSSQSFEFDDTNIARSVFGHRDEFLRIIEHELTVDILWKGNKLTITGDPADAVIARNVLVQLYGIVADGYALGTTDVTRAISLLKGAGVYGPRQRITSTDSPLNTIAASCRHVVFSARARATSSRSTTPVAKVHGCLESKGPSVTMPSGVAIRPPPSNTRRLLSQPSRLA